MFSSLILTLFFRWPLTECRYVTHGGRVWGGGQESAPSSTTPKIQANIAARDNTGRLCFRWFSWNILDGSLHCKINLPGWQCAKPLIYFIYQYWDKQLPEVSENHAISSYAKHYLFSTTNFQIRERIFQILCWFLLVSMFSNLFNFSDFVPKWDYFL